MELPVGLHADEVEAVGVIDVVSKVAETVLLACLGWLLWVEHRRHEAT